MRHHLHRKYKIGTCSVCLREGENLAPNGLGHYVCTDVEGCYSHWKALDPAGINAEPVFVPQPRQPRRRRR